MNCDMKRYNGELGVISLTSWKGRINTVGFTIFSLHKSCPDFHIVLVLSVDEFPNKENDLPKDVLTLLHNNIFEILWVKRNYKAFKKILFTSELYKLVPVISADDDLIYVKNYAKLLYDKWLTCPTSCVGLTSNTVTAGNGFTIADLWGYAQLFPPHFSKYIDLRMLDYFIQYGCIDDDELYNQIRIANHVDAYSFQLPFATNGYACTNQHSNQDSCITNQRLTHKMNDKVLFQKVLR